MKSSLVQIYSCTNSNILGSQELDTAHCTACVPCGSLFWDWGFLLILNSRSWLWAFNVNSWLRVLAIGTGSSTTRQCLGYMDLLTWVTWSCLWPSHSGRRAPQVAQMGVTVSPGGNMPQG